jgi:hypothetical protein
VERQPVADKAAVPAASFAFKEPPGMPATPAQYPLLLHVLASTQAAETKKIPALKHPRHLLQSTHIVKV